MSARNRRLPRHLAWPLTATDVHDALGHLTDELRTVRFLTGLGADRSEPPVVLGVTWLAPRPGNHGGGVHPDSVGFHIDLWPVGSSDRGSARTLLRVHALPQLHEWITRARRADDTWRRTTHRHSWHLADGHLSRSDDPS